MLRSPPHHPMVELPPMQAVGAVSSPGPEHTVATALPCPALPCPRHRHRHRHRFGRQLSLSADSGMAYQMTAEQSREGRNNGHRSHRPLPSYWERHIHTFAATVSPNFATRPSRTIFLGESSCEGEEKSALNYT